MAGAVSFSGSSLFDHKSRPCLCLDFLPSCGDLMISQFGKKRHDLRLNSAFLASSSVRALSVSKKLRKQKKNRGLVVVGELAGQYEETFEDVKRQTIDYFTYKAVRTVLNQLYEMDQTQYRWFYDYIANNENGYGKRFIRDLVKVKQNLGERVMVTRLHLYGKWIKKCDHAEMYERISEQNLGLMRERLMETVIWPPSDGWMKMAKANTCLRHSSPSMELEYASVLYENMYINCIPSFH